MLTLKVITLDQGGQLMTHVFYGDRIIHSERDTVGKKTEIGTITEFCFSRGVTEIGELSNPATSQSFTTSYVQIYDTNKQLKEELGIYPHADCFIMENGKTVDTFSCVFK